MNQIARPLPPSMTADEFLDWPGDGSGRKFELVDGRLRPVSPASTTHGRLQANLTFLIMAAIRAAGLPLWTITEGAVIPGQAPAINVRVPDVIVTGASDREDGKTVLEPVMLVEVLSPSNQRNTRESLRAYATIASVQEIVAVHSKRLRIEVSRRDADGGWSEPEIVGPTGVLRLASVSLAAPMEEVYAGTWLIT